MNVRTLEWGTLEVSEDRLVHFPEGLLGFEELRRFALVELEEYHPFLWLISTDDPEVSFPLADPRYFHEGGYAVHLSPVDEQRLDLRAGDSVAVFVVVTVDPQRGVTANMRGPVVLNTRNRIARQVITYGAGLTLRQPFRGNQEAPIRAAAQPAASRV